MLDPDFFLDEEISSLSPHARLLYQGLWGLCDDNYATLPDRPSWIKLQIFPYEQVNVDYLLSEIQRIGKIVLFDHDGKKYWYIRNFFKYQTVDRPSKPKYPEFKRSKEIVTLFSASLSTLDEYSTSPRHKVKEVKEVKEEFAMKERGKTVDKKKELGEMNETLQKKWRV